MGLKGQQQWEDISTLRTKEVKVKEQLSNLEKVVCIMRGSHFTGVETFNRRIQPINCNPANREDPEEEKFPSPVF